MSKRHQIPRDPRVVVQSNGANGGGELCNISRTGALILTNKPLPVGATVDLNHEIVGDEPLTLEGVAEVVRNHENPVGMGVVFIMLTDTSRTALRTFLERRRS